jgi:hypothetical protein
MTMRMWIDITIGTTTPGARPGQGLGRLRDGGPVASLKGATPSA